MTDITPTTLPELAVMRALPGALPVIDPVEVTEIALVLLDAQVNPDWRTLVLPSEYVPVAVNTWVGPRGKKRVSGVRRSAVNVGTPLPESPGFVPPVPDPLPQPLNIAQAANKKPTRDCPNRFILVPIL